MCSGQGSGTESRFTRQGGIIPFCMFGGDCLGRYINRCYICGHPSLIQLEMGGDDGVCGTSAFAAVSVLGVRGDLL